MLAHAKLAGIASEQSRAEKIEVDRKRMNREVKNEKKWEMEKDEEADQNDTRNGMLSG